MRLKMGSVSPRRTGLMEQSVVKTQRFVNRGIESVGLPKLEGHIEGRSSRGRASKNSGKPMQSTLHLFRISPSGPLGQLERRCHLFAE